MKGLIVKDLFFYSLLLRPAALHLHSHSLPWFHQWYDSLSVPFLTAAAVFFVSLSAFLLHVTSGAVHIPASCVSKGSPI